MTPRVGLTGALLLGLCGSALAQRYVADDAQAQLDDTNARIALTGDALANVPTQIERDLSDYRYGYYETGLRLSSGQALMVFSPIAADIMGRRYDLWDYGALAEDPDFVFFDQAATPSSMLGSTAHFHHKTRGSSPYGFRVQGTLPPVFSPETSGVSAFFNDCGFVLERQLTDPLTLSSNYAPASNAPPNYVGKPDKVDVRIYNSGTSATAGAGCTNAPLMTYSLANDAFAQAVGAVAQPPGAFQFSGRVEVAYERWSRIAPLGSCGLAATLYWHSFRTFVDAGFAFRVDSSSTPVVIVDNGSGSSVRTTANTTSRITFETCSATPPNGNHVTAVLNIDRMMLKRDGSVNGVDPGYIGMFGGMAYVMDYTPAVNATGFVSSNNPQPGQVAFTTPLSVNLSFRKTGSDLVPQGAVLHPASNSPYSIERLLAGDNQAASYPTGHWLVNSYGGRLGAFRLVVDNTHSDFGYWADPCSGSQWTTPCSVPWPSSSAPAIVGFLRDILIHKDRREAEFAAP